MTNSLSKIILLLALFCGNVLADDGNMGNGGRSGCGGTNPPPECSCNQEVPPPNCSGLANVPTSTDKKEAATDVPVVVNEVEDVILRLI
jgi:hypothetical protein